MHLKMKDIRVEKGYTVRSLAFELGVHYSIISYWENGKRKPRSANIMRLEKILETPSHILFEEVEEEENE